MDQQVILDPHQLYRQLRHIEVDDNLEELLRQGLPNQVKCRKVSRYQFTGASLRNPKLVHLSIHNISLGTVSLQVRNPL